MIRTIGKKALSILLSVMLVIGLVPLTAITFTTALAADEDSRVADLSTMDGWKDLFGPTHLSTENAGGVWTDKSVFTNASAFGGTGITMQRDDSFLVALSAIASNIAVAGMSYVPTDTMLVLDVSGSMNSREGNNALSDEMVDAANSSIKTLLESGKYNRVGVILYSGSSSTNNSDAALTLLPLGRYTTGSDGEYLSYSKTGYGDRSVETVSIDSDVVNEETGRAPQSASKQVYGATYIQRGVVGAMEEFMDQLGDTKVTDPVLGVLDRVPVMVLMTDGAPTLATTSFTNPGDNNLGNGSTATAATGFLSQLSIAYVKAKMTEVYGSALLYTLGLGVSNDSIATSVVNPSNSSSAISELWTNYNAAEVGDDVTVHTERNGFRVTYYNVEKIDLALDKNYVDGYFEADTASSNPGAELESAFDEIVGTIQLQSRYFPTLVETNEHLSGWVTFEDEIGYYMDVVDIKGLLINNTLYSGATLASNFVTSGGALGTPDNPTALGTTMIAAIGARLGISADEARTLASLAFAEGQISYNASTGEYSNYIGWYANAAGEFLGFWHEGITTMPDPSDPTLTDATRPAYIYKSYGYLGAVDEDHGVTASDMMYASIRVSEEIATGSVSLHFSVPASLIPTVTYEVELDENGSLTSLAVSGANHPIRLVYEVALDSEINEVTVESIVGDNYEYINADGSYDFYTNKWQNEIVYNEKNTYSYFRPATENDRYYYTTDSLIYTDTNGTLYSGTSAPLASGTYYRAIKTYADNPLRTTVVYERISSKSLAKAQSGSNGNWYVPAGTVHTLIEDFEILKAENKTESLKYAYEPFVDAEYSYIVGATHGNNGRITVVPATGIKITKEIDVVNTTSGANTSFEFTVTNLTNPADNGTYTYYHVDADANVTKSTVTFTGGSAVVNLKDGESAYITGLAAGTRYSIDETESEYYIVSSINGTTSVSGAEVVLQNQTLSRVNFVNTARGEGDLTVTKEIAHSFGTDFVIPADKKFEITITLDGVGVKGKSFEAKHKGDASVTSVTVNANGEVVVLLGHDESFEIFGLPEGTEATVVEKNPGDGFVAGYYDNGIAGDGKVTILKDNVVSVIIGNYYTPEELTSASVKVSGTKYLIGREWVSSDSFTFVLERYDAATGSWKALGTAGVNGSDADRVFDFGSALANEIYTTTGTYYYRIKENAGTQGGMDYDTTVHAFGVIIGDSDLDGKLEIADVVAYRDTVHVTQDGNGNWSVDADFTNTYDAASTTASIEINKSVVNNSASPLATLAGFTFGLYDADGNLVATSDKTTERGFTRFNMTYTEAGTYAYVLKEIVPAATADGWSYSSAEYAVTVEVVDSNNGYLVAYAYIGTTKPDGASSQTSVTFENTYAPAEATLALDVRKNLSGRPLRDGEFTFEIRERDTRALVATGKNNAQGKVTFDKALTFDKVGAYYYDIVETSADANGVTTDKSVRRVTVTVTDNGGKLVATYSVLNVANNVIEFNNTYNASSVDYSIGGSKVLDGRVLLNDEFVFTLTESDSAGNIANGAKTYTARNFSDGHFAFPAITYTEAGTYYYIVAESDEDKIYGITYDTTRYHVEVVIADNGLGQLVVSTVEMHIEGGSGVDEIEFVNSYVPSPTKESLGGSKIFEGKVLTAGEFGFNLYLSDASWTKGALIENVSNNANGVFAFSEIEYVDAGTYYYLISESHGGQVINGITYDDSVYRVKVTVSDDGRGSLVSVVNIYNSENVPVEAPVFTNTYLPSGTTADISGEKVLVGRPLRDGEFSFILKDADGNTIETVKNDALGNFSFTELDFDTTGTFVYTVNEVKGTVGGIRYDETVYTVTVIVSDDGLGSLVADVNGAENIIFTNTYAATSTEATIRGRKVLDGRLLKAGEFSFNLIDSNGQIIDVVKNEANGDFAFDAITFTAPGEYTYVIYEVSGFLGGVEYDDTVYTLTITVTDDGEGTLTANIPPLSVEFNNKYSANSTTVQFSGSKKLNGRPLALGEFGFALVDADGNTIETVYNLSNGGFAFAPITYTSVGTYTYEVVELAGNAGGVTYDSTAYTIKVVVTDNGEGKLVASVEGADAIVFTNSYKAESTDAEFGGNKVLDGRVLLDGEFSFVLKDASGNELETVKNKADGKFVFSPITYTEAGTYVYTVSEVSGNAGGVSYDTHVYTVTVTVTDDMNGKLTASVSGDTGIVFRNTYSADSATASLAGTKTIDGRALVAGEFSFVLKDESGKELETVKNEADGTFRFSTITYNKAGTYNYTVSEVKGELGGVSYDGTVYAVKVVVTDNGEGKLIASVEGAQAIKFANKYKADSTSVSFGGNKTLSGRELADGEFIFELKDASGAVIESVKNAKDGKFGFSSITYTEAGTYTYTVSELEETLGGVTYDKSVYTITVTVVDDLNGKLVANVVGADNIVFANTYKAEADSVKVEANKTLSGRELADGEFSFELKDASGNVVETVKNTADGKVAFSTLTFDKVGTYIYTVNEIKGVLGGVSYDESVYTVSVTVSDNGEGRLVAKAVITKGEQSAEKIEFVNTYALSSSSAVISGTKVLVGRDIVDGEFSFELKDSDGNVLETTTVKADGSFAFGSIAIEKAGTYTYTVSEVAGEDAAITYDATVYTVTVSAVDGGNGELIISTDILDAEAVVFTNTYTSPSPDTGDNSALVLWIGGAVLALTVGAVLGKKRRVED